MALLDGFVKALFLRCQYEAEILRNGYLLRVIGRCLMKRSFIDTSVLNCSWPHIALNQEAGCGAIYELVQLENKPLT